MFEKARKALVLGACFLVLLYTSVCALLYFGQDTILFPAQKISAEKKYDFAVPFEEVWIDVEGANLHGLYFSAPNPKGLIIFFHGNAEKAEEFAGSAPEFTSQGYDYFIPDYRGYGKSSDKLTSESQFLNDADRVFAWALAKYPADKIILGGRSLGAVPAAYLAAKHPVKRAVLIAPFFNIAAMAEIRYPFLPKALVRYHFRNDLWVPQILGPVDFIHGTEDITVPFEHSKRLFALAREPKQHFSVPGAGHNNLQDFQAYHDILSALMRL